jgi:diguanylate cyclase (GGDEF)-like protein
VDKRVDLRVFSDAQIKDRATQLDTVGAVDLATPPQESAATSAIDEPLPAAAKLYLAAVVLAGFIVGGFMATHTAPLDTKQAAVALAFFIAMTVTGFVPLSTGAKVKLIFDTAIFVAAVLIFTPGVAVLVTTGGVLLAQSFRREAWDQILFNGAQTALQAAAGAGILVALGWHVDDLTFSPVEIVLALVVGIGVLLLNSLLVAPMVALQTGDSLPQVWTHILLGAGPLQIASDVAQVGLGVVMAYLATTRSPLLVLLLIPAVAGYTTIAHHLQLRRQAEERLQHQAFHDALTDLPNRALLLERLEDAMQRQAGEGEQVALLFMDLDRFKLVNDSLGHAAGDELLKAVARRLCATVRPGDTVARLGGDEFAILLENVPSRRAAERAAADLSACVSASFDLSGKEVFIAASVGVSLSAASEAGATRLLHEADVALYRVKRQSKGNWVVFDPAVDGAGWERATLEVQLRQAIQDDSLWLAYQPLVDLATNRLVGLEALVRWHHPERGTMLPRAFVPVAEQTGLVVPFGRWVLETACRQGHLWQERYREAPVVSVNLSARQFLQPELVEDIARVLQSTGMAPDRLKLEITERTMMTNVDKAANILRKLRALGVRIAIDDFGSGYSSLSYLRHFPIDQLKIDQEFIAGLERQNEARVIVRAVIALAQALQIEIVAEGVESPAQAADLRSWGCELGQGFHFGRPLSAKATTSLLDSKLAIAALEVRSSA